MATNHDTNLETKQAGADPHSSTLAPPSTVRREGAGAHAHAHGVEEGLRLQGLPRGRGEALLCLVPPAAYGELGRGEKSWEREELGGKKKAAARPFLTFLSL